jgi:hypothetical protein
MKFNPLNLLAALVISGLITYGIINIESNIDPVVIGTGSFLFVASTLVALIGFSFRNGRVSTNIRVVAGLFFGVALFFNLLFAYMDFSQVMYVIGSGVSFLLYLVIVNAVANARQ